MNTQELLLKSGITWCFSGSQFLNLTFVSNHCPDAQKYLSLGYKIREVEIGILDQDTYYLNFITSTSGLISGECNLEEDRLYSYQDIRLLMSEAISRKIYPSDKNGYRVDQFTSFNGTPNPLYVKA